MIGSRIGRYEIVAEIGRGGMGIVYRAIQTSLNRTVAVKMLPPHLALSGEYLARFQREAETLARLAHENIVHIYDIEEKDGAHFIVMEYVAGGSLSELLKREGRIDPARARDIASMIADGLGAAHRQGIIHRDIKPDNILFSPAGQPKLTDFGIAHMRDTKFKTQTGMFMGTPIYSSPEQARGAKVSATSDLYSLGIVLYQMLCGVVPFHAEDPLAIALKHIQEAPPPLGGKGGRIPGPFCQLVHRLLEKDPRARFPGAHPLREALLSLDLGRPPGLALSGIGSEALGAGSSSLCPECHTPLREEFMTCPRCGRAINRRCTKCGQFYDPVSPECPFCRTPAGRSEGSPSDRGGPEEETILTPPTPSPAAGGAASESPAAEAAARAAQKIEEEGKRFAREGIKVAKEGIEVAKEGARAAGEGAAKVAEHVPVSQSMIGRLFSRIETSVDTGSGKRIIWIGGLLLLLAILFLILKPVLSRTTEPYLAQNSGSASQESGSGTEIPGAGNPGESARSPQVDPSEVPPAGPKGERAQPEEERGDAPEEQVLPGEAEKSVRESDAVQSKQSVRQEIERIVERQRVALEAGDLEGALADMSTEMRWEREKLLKDVFVLYRDIAITINDLRVTVGDAEHAQVSFATSFGAIRITDGTRERMQAKEFWKLSRASGRWLITSIWNENE